MPLLFESKMRTAIINKDKSFDGQFFYGVITTGIFCLPSCPSKSANPENIRFFSDFESALLAGFRACKRCNPKAEDPRTRKLIEIARYIENHVDQKITLSNLGEIAGLSPSRLQRVFNALFGVSPKAYQDAIRMRHFKDSLKEGSAITDAIYSAGFGSISRVYGEATRNIGMTPKKYRAGGVGEVINYACRETSIGWMIMAATDKGVCTVQFADDETSLIVQLKKEFPKAELIVSSAHSAPELDLWIAALEQNISQGAPKPDLPLDIRGTVFQIKVWSFLLSIKEGDTFNYGEVAERINSPKAARAVGTACGKNTIAILIPCHRVLRSGGGLGGYRWGLKLKQALLDKEKAS